MEDAGNVPEVVCFAERPEETIADLVSNGDNLDGDVVRSENVAYFEGVVVYLPR